MRNKHHLTASSRLLQCYLLLSKNPWFHDVQGHHKNSYKPGLCFCLSWSKFPVPAVRCSLTTEIYFSARTQGLMFLLIQSFMIELKIWWYSFGLDHIIVFHESRLMMQLFFRKPSISTLTIDFHTWTQVNISTINLFSTNSMYALFKFPADNLCWARILMIHQN